MSEQERSFALQVWTGPILSNEFYLCYQERGMLTN
jgi:hypothetical protein